MRKSCHLCYFLYSVLCVNLCAPCGKEFSTTNYTKGITKGTKAEKTVTFVTFFTIECRFRIFLCQSLSGNILLVNLCLINQDKSFHKTYSLYFCI